MCTTLTVLMETLPSLFVTMILILCGPGFSVLAACQAIAPLNVAGKPLLTKCTRLRRVSRIVISRTPFAGLLAETAICNGPLKCCPERGRRTVIAGGAKFPHGPLS